MQAIARNKISQMPRLHTWVGTAVRALRTKRAGPLKYQGKHPEQPSQGAVWR
jgi:hypothetical protein